MTANSEKTGRTIAVTGKGGTGKTVLSTLMIKSLVDRKGLHILAVDADSAQGLPYTLGMPVTRTVGAFRQEIIDNPQEKRRISDLHMGEVIGEIVTHGPGFDLLVMGRPEAPGCFCGVNDLLRYGIESLSRKYDVTIIDGEAGPEQVNRRVMQRLDALLVVADPSVRSLGTARDIMGVARNQGIVQEDRIGLVVNKFTDTNDQAKELVKRMDFNVWGYIPYDENVSLYDSQNKSLLDLPNGSPSLSAISTILERIS